MNGDFFLLTHADALNPIAVVGPPDRGVFPVSFLEFDAGSPDDDERVLGDVRRSLSYYLVELGEQDPWAYAKYHTTTVANATSDVCWGFVEHGRLPKDVARLISERGSN